MSSGEEETFKRLQRTPYRQVKTAILSEKDDFAAVNFILNSLTEQDKEYIASVLPEHGWEYQEFMDKFEEEASENLRQAALRFKARMEKLHSKS